MAYYKLVASGRSDVQADEIILKRDDYGEVELSLSATLAREIPDDSIDAVKAAVEKLGFSVEEAEKPVESAVPGSQIDELQQVGTDILGTAPLLESNTQEGNETPVPVDQGSTDVTASGGTSDSGSPSSSATPSSAQSAPPRTVSS